MAGEQKGKAYEAFTKAALEALRKKGVFKGDIFWDEKAEGMTIVPDLTIGPDKDHPHTVILITHCGSAKNSDMKYWRNMGELAEIKILLPVVPKVFNLVFDSVIKENLKEAQAASFDGQLLVGDLRYGTELQEWIDENLGSFPKDKNEKVDFLIQEAKNDKELRRILGAFSSDLEALLKKKAPPELEQVWAMERKRAPGRAPRARDTFVRRGLSKLLIFEDLDVSIRLFSGKRVTEKEVPAYAFELGLASKAVGRVNPADEEITNAVVTLGEHSVRSVINKAPRETLNPWLNTLRNLPHVRFASEYVANYLGDLSHPRELLNNLQALYLDPESLTEKLSTPTGWAPRTVWLMEAILEILKHSTGNAAGFGYAQLARAVANPNGPARGISRKAAEYLLSPWGHLSEWINRVPNKDIPPEVLNGVCLVLADMLRVESPANIIANISALIESVRTNLIEAKLCTYRSFEPLRILIEGSVPGARLDQARSCFGEKAELPGQATKTTVLRKGQTLINWQSASDAGRDHKKKELCGRAVALRYSWDSKHKRFIPRPGVQKLVLVVDGTWRREDLLALARAGWDEIFYPDEMDKLAAAIV
jgi:hypothetical protein